VPAAAVIPAPIAYINAAAVETLVVGLLDELLGRPLAVPCSLSFCPRKACESESDLGQLL
jgi:hypothetical protein